MHTLTTSGHIAVLPSGPSVCRITPGSVVVKVPTVVFYGSVPGIKCMVMRGLRVPSLACFPCYRDVGDADIFHPGSVAHLCNSNTNGSKSE